MALLGATRARAAEGEPTERIRLTYEAPSTCPPETVFAGQLRARTSRAEIVESGEERSFAISVKAGDRGALRGRLDIRANERSYVREVDGRTCDEVVAALALIAALAIDPHASTKAVAALEIPPPEPVAPLVVEERPFAFGPSAIDALARPLERAPRPIAKSGGVAMTVGGDVTLRTGLLPANTPLVGVAVGVAADESSRSVLSPSAFVTASTSLGDLRATSGGAAAKVSWLGARSSLCPVRFALSQTWDVRPCAAFELGRMRARSEGLSDPQADDRLWFAVGGSLFFQWNVARHVLLAAHGAVLAPIRQDRFYAGPSTTLFEVPGLGTSWGIILGFNPFS